jgi:ABC-type multidrug transport system fused ATPase/permease subunit
MFNKQKYFGLKSKFHKVLMTLSPKDIKFFVVFAIIQSIVAMLDVAGIYLVGVLGILASNLFLGYEKIEMVTNLLDILRLTNYQAKDLIFILSFVIVIFFIFKSLLSIFISRKMLLIYARKQSDYSNLLLQKLLNSNFSWIKKLDFERVHSAIIEGAEALFVKVLGNLMVIISDILLLLFVLIFLVWYNTVVSLFTFLFFISVAIILQKFIGTKALVFGKIHTDYTMKMHSQLQGIFFSFKEIFVSNQRDFFQSEFQSIEKVRAVAGVKSLWIQQIPKYFFEIALTLGIFFLSFAMLSSPIGNISTLVVFIVAAGRLVPALFRIQSGLLGISVGYSKAQVAIEFFDEIAQRIDLPLAHIEKPLDNPPSIQLQSVFFKFPDSNKYILKDITMNIKSGETVAFVGRSGSGKSTLVDLILNIYIPNKGTVILKDGNDEITPGKCQHISYVSQNPAILKGSLLQNITLGRKGSKIDEKILEEAIAVADLKDLIQKLPQGLSTELNSLGGILSGGEKQRIAISRALYMQPKLLVIDEGTSSLDVTSEKFVMKNLLCLEKNTTIIFIAHRISTIKNVDKIYFLQNGEILGSGKFNELQKTIPEFHRWTMQFNLES